MIPLGPSQYNVTSVMQMVTQQVGYDIILLDSKCLPVLLSEVTLGVDCILEEEHPQNIGCIKSVYERLIGKIELTEEAAPVDLTDDDPVEAGPSRKKQKVDDYCELVEKVTCVEKWLLFLDKLANSFNCVIYL